MTDRAPTPMRPTSRSHVPTAAHAVESMPDAPFLAYALVQSFKLFIALVSKRWPEVARHQ